MIFGSLVLVTCKLGARRIVSSKAAAGREQCDALSVLVERTSLVGSTNFKVKFLNLIFDFNAGIQKIPTRFKRLLAHAPRRPER